MLPNPIFLLSKWVSKQSYGFPKYDEWLWLLFPSRYGDEFVLNLRIKIIALEGLEREYNISDTCAFNGFVPRMILGKKPNLV